MKNSSNEPVQPDDRLSPTKMKLSATKMETCKAKEMLRKKKRRWVAFGKTEQWWRNMIGGMVPEEN